MNRWRRLRAERLHDCRVFDLYRVRFSHPARREPGEFFVVEAPDWINVIPLTDDGDVVLVRQYRFGLERVTLEIPGGMCDAGESPQDAARRELREETGYDAREILPLGFVHPNPAIQTNRCHTFLARGAHRVGEPAPDPNEVIEVETARLDQIPGLIRSGSISHSLVVSAFHLLGLNDR